MFEKKSGIFSCQNCKRIEDSKEFEQRVRSAENEFIEKGIDK